MKVIGIICEYNPFHNGHKYHIDKIKEKYPESILILALNGLFLERGEFSIQTKEQKTKIALESGVDLVVELPFVYGTQSADNFACAAIKILNALKCDTIIFGSESNDAKTLIKIANKQLNDNDYDNNVKTLLNNGHNYPTALAKALQIDNFEFLPNDLLGISYAKAILKNNFNINIETIKRTNSYKDIISSDNIISAANIRNKIHNNEDISLYLPEVSKNNLIKINTQKYFELLKYKINTDKDLSIYLDVDEGIEYRLKEYINTSHSLNDFINNVKTKRYTYNKINRMLIHILIGLTKKDNQQLNIDYLHILGFNKTGQDYLNQIKDEIQVTTTINKASLIYKYEIEACIIYDLINNTHTINFEKQNKPIIID